PPRPVQEQIHQLVIEAYEKRQRAIELEDEAIALVESAIEQAASAARVPRRMGRGAPRQPGRVRSPPGRNAP
ncbi:MAG: hypothetical protein GY862_28410, partial [Gammaproteobacteria bacterium]|nr:hypothetical protein [Gammaproteobacteria bacterium]